jgi:hypothetical protein
MILIIFVTILFIMFIGLYYNNLNQSNKFTETFKANSNLQKPSINFDYLSKLNYSKDILNKYYLDNDNNDYFRRLLNNKYRYKHTTNNEHYYYGMNYSPEKVANSNKIYSLTGIRY